MESFSPSLDLKPPPFDASQPLAPCPTVAEQHKLYCYLQVADNLVRGTGYAWNEVAAACATEPDAAVARDLLPGLWPPGVGQQLRQAAGGRGALRHGGRRRAGVRLRRGTGHREQRRERCACRDVLSRPVTAREQARCFEGVGTILASLETDGETLRRQCAELSAAHTASCVRGAGLPA